MGKRILYMCVYGNDLVMSCGAAALNVKNGGETFVSVMLLGEKMAACMEEVAKILGVSKVYNNHFAKGDVDGRHEQKVELVRVIREVKPDIIITQDPEECVGDLDPDRRPAMNLLLEAIALASRDFALDEMPGLEPHPIPKIYYKTPHHPNCVLNVEPVWDTMQKAVEAYGEQLSFTAKIMETRVPMSAFEAIIPGYAQLGDNYYEKGRRLTHAMDLAKYMYNGIAGHGSFAMAEPYKLEGIIELTDL